MRSLRALSIALGLCAAALGLAESLPPVHGVEWFVSPERVAWSAAEPPSVCALDAFHFGVRFAARTSVQYNEKNVFQWQLVADKVEGWEVGAVVVSGELSAARIRSQQQTDAEQGDPVQGLGEEGIRCELDPQFCFPTLVNIRLPDIDPKSEDGPSLQAGHTMELEFQQPTNRPDASSKEKIEQFVVFTEYIGDEMVGTWAENGRVLVLQILRIDEEKVKSAGELMQGLLQTGIFLKEERAQVVGEAVLEGAQSLRVEPPGTYFIRVLIADELAMWSPGVSIQACDASFIVVNPLRLPRDSTISANQIHDDIRDKDPSFEISGVLTHGGEEGFTLSHDTIRMDMAGSWSLSCWVFLTEDSTGSFRTLFFNGDGQHEQRTPSAWWMPDQRRLVLRVSTITDADVGLDSSEELPLNQWIHMGFTFSNCSEESAETEEFQLPRACQQNPGGENNWSYSFAFYVNGLLDKEVRLFDPVAANNGPLNIGKGPWTDGMHGFTSNLKVFPVPISSEGMRKLYFDDQHIHTNHVDCARVGNENARVPVATQISILFQCLKFGQEKKSVAYGDSFEVEKNSSFVELQLALFEEAAAARESCEPDAWDLIVEAADLGHATACLYVGEAYLYGSYAAEQKDCSVPVQHNFSISESYLRKAFGNDVHSAGKALALLLDVAEDNDMSQEFRLTPFTTGLLHFAAAGGKKEAFAMLGRRYQHGLTRNIHGKEVAAYHYFHAAVKAATEFHQLGKQPLHEMIRLYDSLERDVTAGERGDDDELIQFQKMRADKEGDVGAMAAMGDLYYWGAHGIPRDHAQAYNYFNRAAHAGDVDSQSAVAGMLLKGEGTAQDNVTAIKWYEKAAERNHTRALNGLGFIHFHGSGGVPENKSLALQYFERAAENQEDGDSVFNAGYCHAMGLGTNANISRAMNFYDVAARKFGHFDAIFEMGKLLMIGVEDMLPRNSKKALQYLKAASDGGQWGRVVRNGFDLYTNGEFERAAVLYHEARELGYPVATSNLAFLYDQRLLRSANVASERRALKYLIWANQENGDRETLVRIGDYHYYGLAGLRKDPQTAIRWYSRASAAGVNAGAYNVGHMYEFGDGVEVNLDRARRYYERILALSPSSTEIQLAIRFALCRLALRQWLQNTPLEMILGFNTSLEGNTGTNLTATDSTTIFYAATSSFDSKMFAVISTTAMLVISIAVWYFHGTR
ncbi:unnamed protein product [Phytophthora fragariaefolia]|uniref:Unnamed protein product n=1 Tax=Phytophthora fragariaefolia TaxID=1490495 RepID=A0A9W6X3T7_9STRA|nr:unnamed protein product [Phytophthora fragariaefolia]